MDNTRYYPPAGDDRHKESEGVVELTEDPGGYPPGLPLASHPPSLSQRGKIKVVTDGKETKIKGRLSEYYKFHWGMTIPNH